MKKCIATNEESDETQHFSKTMRESLTYVLLQLHLKDPSFTFEDLQSHVNTFIAAVSLFMIFIAIFLISYLNINIQK